MLYVVLLLAQLLCCAAAWEHVIYVDPLEGNNTQECINGSEPCRNLSFAFQPEYRRSSTQYVLLPGTHYLGNSTYDSPFTNLDGLAIVGNGSNSLDTVIECNAPNSGLAFVGVSNIYLERVTFNHCAGLRNSTSRDYTLDDFAMQKSQAALYFYLCNNVSMSMVDVSNSPDATGVVMYDTIGTNRIEHCTFSNNRIGHTSPYPGGGGFYVEFSYCAPGDDNCAGDVSYVFANSNSQFLFHHCTFENNKAGYGSSYSNSTFIVPYHRNHVAFGRGGGLSVFFKGNASKNMFNVSSCLFNNNRAVWGAGIFAEFHDSTAGNNVSIKDSTVYDNLCSYTGESGTGGGGMRLGHYVYSKGVPNMDGNSIMLQNCSFQNNSALNGGALSISAALQNTDHNQLASVHVNSCHFENNVAELGTAIYISRFSLIVEGEILTVTILDGEFIANSILHYEATTHVHQELGIGAVYVNAIPVQFQEKAYFECNSGSAICIVGAQANFSGCNAIFLKNTGSKGGAIALLGSASILINEFTNMSFEDNSAVVYGGAIYNKYTERENKKIYANCFIHHVNPLLDPDDWNATFYFRNNSATLGGSSIHSTSILSCSIAGGFKVSNISQILCWENWVYEDTNCSSEIGTEAGHVELKYSPTKSSSVKAFPGKAFKLPITIQDDLEHNVSHQTIFAATLNDSTRASVDPDFRYVSRGVMKISGQENSSFTLNLVNIGDRVWQVKVNVSLQPCPPGFELSNTTSIQFESNCVCAGSFSGKVKCRDSSYKARLVSAYWMGPSPEQPDKWVVSMCRYCYIDPQKNLLPLPNSSQALDGLLCGKQNRTGILCGKCKDGYGHAINSAKYRCVYCNDTNIAANATYYVLSVYLPLFILFAAIILFNIKLTTGPANAFIVYSQVVASTFDLDGDDHIPLKSITKHMHVLLKAYRIPYDIFNLKFLERFIPPLCLGTNLNILDLLQLDYVVAVFPLLMIIVVLAFLKLRDHVCRCKLQKLKIGDSLVHAFAAFILLSYTRFSLDSSYLVNLQPLLDKNGNPVGPQRAYYAGQFSADEPKYTLRYYLPACIVFATFVAIPPLLLLEYPVKLLEWCINKVNFLRMFYPVDKVYILLDTFQGCYRNKMRFFAGLYFLFRLIINVSYILTDDYGQQFVLQQIVCTIFVVLIALCQPYTKEKKIFNYVDTLIFANLALLNALSLYLYTFSQANPSQPLPVSAFVIQYILVFLPLIYMIGYLLWYCLAYFHVGKLLADCCLSQVFILACEFCHVRIRHNTVHGSYEHLQGSNYHARTVTRSEVVLDEPEDEMEAMLERAENINTYKPTLQNVNDTDAGEQKDSGLRFFPPPNSSSYGTN